MTMTNSEMAKVQEKTLARLVKKILWRKPTKDWQRNDRIELSVWQLRDALESAYLAGKNSADHAR